MAGCPLATTARHFTSITGLLELLLIPVLGCLTVLTSGIPWLRVIYVYSYWRATEERKKWLTGLHEIRRERPLKHPG
jgi:hypothetical protein